jgi:transposase InsO family protein
MAKKKQARKRLRILKLAEKLGNVSEACRRRSISRTQFYEYKRRFQTHGLDGLVDQSPIPHSHPQTTPPETVEQLLALSLEHPTWGCHRLSDQLELIGVSVSGPTIQKILDQHELGSRYARWLQLETQAAEQGIELTAEQVAAIEKANPCFHERHVESDAPGALLCQDTFYVGHLKSGRKIYLQAVVDTFSSFGFGYLHTGKRSMHPVWLLHKVILPQFKEWGVPIGTILTGNSPEYCGNETHPYEGFLSYHDIEHRTIEVPPPGTYGSIERFRRTIINEFFRPIFQTIRSETAITLYSDLDAWLQYYNFERPHQGYPNMGKRPIDTVNAYLKTVRSGA